MSAKRSARRRVELTRGCPSLQGPHWAGARRQARGAAVPLPTLSATHGRRVCAHVRRRFVRDRRERPSGARVRVGQVRCMADVGLGRRLPLEESRSTPLGSHWSTRRRYPGSVWLRAPSRIKVSGASAGVDRAVYLSVYRSTGAKSGFQRPRETNRFRSLTWGFVVRPLGLEPRTCGLRDRKEPSVRCGIVR
jgi:hypothetical protein